MKRLFGAFVQGLVLFSSASFGVQSALAQASPQCQPQNIIGGICVESGPPVGYKVNPITIIETSIRWAFGLLIVLASVFIVYAAFEFLTSAGDAEKVKRAKNLILYAVISIAVAFLARTIVYIVRTLLRSGFTG